MRVPAALLKEFILSLSGKAGTTVDAYQRELRHFLDWISQRAGNSGPFDAQQQLTKTALQSYLTHLQSEGHSVSHCARVKSAVGGFARWLTEEKQLLRRNPARGEALFALGYWPEGLQRSFTIDAARRCCSKIWREMPSSAFRSKCRV